MELWSKLHLFRRSSNFTVVRLGETTNERGWQSRKKQFKTGIDAHRDFCCNPLGRSGKIMKTTLVGLASLLFATTSALAQNYSIDWFTVDGGGGTSTGGVYSVSGTIGQPDAGVLTGGSYSLIGGFWGAAIPIQVEGGPTLYIQNQLNGTAKIYWVPNTPGFVLQEAAALTPTPVSWANAPVTYTNGATIPASLQTRFFRLIKP